MLEVQAGGATLRLMPQRAVYLPQHKSLLVADAHIGKAVSFRRAGLPVPQGTTEETLAQLSAALQSCGAEQVVFLGDLLHSARSRAPGTVAAVAAWRAGHRQLALTLVRGNHDQHAGDPPPDWGVQVLEGPLQVGPLALTHHPEPVEGAYVLAGHLHPAAVLEGPAHDRLRLPCFHFGQRVGVLPAFGAFTGMHVVRAGAGERVYVVAGDEVRALHCAA